MKVVDRLLKRVTISIKMDPAGGDSWDQGRALAYLRAKEAKPSDLQSWAIRELEMQENHTVWLRENVAESDPLRQGLLDMSEGVEAGYRDIIAELVVQPAK